MMAASKLLLSTERELACLKWHCIAKGVLFISSVANNSRHYMISWENIHKLACVQMSNESAWRVVNKFYVHNRKCAQHTKKGREERKKRLTKRQRGKVGKAGEKEQWYAVAMTVMASRHYFGTDAYSIQQTMIDETYGHLKIMCVQCILCDMMCAVRTLW